MTTLRIPPSCYPATLLFLPSGVSSVSDCPSEGIYPWSSKHRTYTDRKRERKREREKETRRPVDECSREPRIERATREQPVRNCTGSAHQAIQNRIFHLGVAGECNHRINVNTPENRRFDSSFALGPTPTVNRQTHAAGCPRSSSLVPRGLDMIK